MSASSDQLKDKGVEVLSKMIDITVQSMSDVVEFGKQQIPEVIHQLLLWRATSATVWMVLGLVVLIGGWKCLKQVNKMVEETGDDDYYIFHIFSAILAAAGCAVFMPNFLEVLQIMVAPKIYLIEYASELIKK